MRDIDRETVLKINRRPRHRSADYAWPPQRLSPLLRPLQKRPLSTNVTSCSHQNINDIKDIFEHQSNRSESNTLTRLLQRNVCLQKDEAFKNKSNKIIDNNRKDKKKHDNDNDDDEKGNIIITDNNKNHRNTDNNRKILSSSSTENEDQKFLYENIHLWPPISSQSSQYNLNKSSVRRANDWRKEDDKLEQIIKKHFHIIDKKYENNINFHDWHGVPEKSTYDDDGVVHDDYDEKGM